MKAKLTFLVAISTIISNIICAADLSRCGANATWAYDSISQTLTISGSGAMYNYSDAQLAPWNQEPIKNIIIAEGITEIGNYSFYFCDKINYVYFPNSLKRIGSLSFMGCTSLADINLPCNLSVVERSAFSYCHKLQYVTCSSQNLKIEDYAFGYCENLKTITLPSLNDVSLFAFDKRTKKVYLNRSISVDDFENANVDKGTKQPPLLAIVPNSTQFIEPSGNNAIDGNEKCWVTFKVRNEGKGVARNCVLNINTVGSTTGITFNIPKISSIAPDQVQEITIPINASKYTKDGDITFFMQVDEPNGFGTDPIELNVKTRAFEMPFIQIVDYAVMGTNGAQLKKKSPFDLQLMLQNTKFGKAEDVDVEISLPENVILISGSQYTHFSDIKGGEAKSIEYGLIVNNNYSSGTIPIQIKLKEKYGNYAENKEISLQLNQVLSSTKLNVDAIEAPQKNEIKLATIGSDVDKNIPQTDKINEKTFAVIIANENYQQVASVPFALNDGNIFAQYCKQTLGIPQTNMHIVTDATINNIKQQVNWLKQVISAYNGDAKVIFYYAGHGVPDEKSKSAFLLPIDGNGSDITTGYKLDDLYSALGTLPTQSVVIFLDACFSGTKREEGMLASARGVAIKVKNGQPVGNTVVFSAATEDETAYPNNGEGHGMFTYYLLKKLQETVGDVTLEELGNYIRQNVSQKSIVLNGKSQTPTVSSSEDAKDWQQWKLNN